MKDSTSTNSQDSPGATPQDGGFSPWQRLKGKRISYLTLPLLIMATITEFVILATGWKYQQVVCLPQGMGVTFFGIGPIGATILAVELLKLPLAIWTASRVGWQKGFMLLVGLPLICVLTFQLVKDMAVYEMGTAMTPASQFLEKATAEEIKITQLNGELQAIDQKKTDRQHKLDELSAKQAKAKTDFEELLKRNDDKRQDAITLTDYQKKELSEVESRQTAIIQQFNADTAQITKALTDLRASREVELGRATKWNAEEARIENAYKTKLAEYTNKKSAYEKDKAEYDNANFLKRQLLKEPIDPGVAPEREANTVLKPTAIAEIDSQIKAKEAELVAVNNKRRDRVAQVDADARQVRAEFDKRSSTKREETDRKREELAAAQAALAAEAKAEQKQIDADLAVAVQKVDGIRADIDSARKKAEGYYEAREASIKNTQVHRIATTVEIVRGLFKGERPMSIKATAKERGDILTDQISMVRIWVYPVLAFIVAFLPTLMVEIGFSTVFHPEQQRPPHRLGFFGRRLHWLYKRAGRQKILRAERLAAESAGAIAVRDRALVAAKAATEKALAEKEAAVLAAREANEVAAIKREDQFKKQEDEWVSQLAAMADSLNRTVVEKDALKDLQKSEIERQISMRQNAWSERVTQLRQELDTQRAASETERTALMQDHQKKLFEVSEECKTQVIQTRRQLADADLAAVEKNAKLSHDLKEALRARDAAEAQLKHQGDSLSLRLTQAQEDATRELEKVTRQEKLRADRQQSDFDKVMRQREEDFERRLSQREQELTLEADARVVEEKSKVESAAQIREAELERQLEARGKEMEAHWNRELQQRDEVAQIRLKQREQQLQAQADARLRVALTQAEEQLRRRELELDRQLDAQAREGESRLREELQQKELAFHARSKEREQDLSSRAAARETELQNRWAADLRAREEELEQQAGTRVRAVEARFAQEGQQKEENFQLKQRQREQQLQSQLEMQAREIETRFKEELQQKELAFQGKIKEREQDLASRSVARQAELQTQWAQNLRAREEELERQTEARVRAVETRFTAEAQQKEEGFQLKLRQREQQLQSQFEGRQTELQTQCEQAELRVRALEARAAHEVQQREDNFQLKLRQREQQLQTQFEARQAELQIQLEQGLRRRDVELTETKQREQDLAVKLTTLTDAYQMAEKELKADLDTVRGNFESLRASLTRAEKERDEAREAANEGDRQLDELRKKSLEASSLLSGGWKNGKMAGGRG